MGVGLKCRSEESNKAEVSCRWSAGRDQFVLIFRWLLPVAVAFYELTGCCLPFFLVYFSLGRLYRIPGGHLLSTGPNWICFFTSVGSCRRLQSSWCFFFHSFRRSAVSEQLSGRCLLSRMDLPAPVGLPAVLAFAGR